MKVKSLDQHEQLEGILSQSFETPVLIFKHSSTCPISAAAKREIDLLTEDQACPPIFQVIVQDSREISHEIAASLGITHQSPQLIVIKEGRAVYDCSHAQVTKNNVMKAVEQYI